MATDDVAGTVTHMAPELLLGDPMSAAADVYAFAILSKLTFSAADVYASAVLSKLTFSSRYCDML